MRYIILFSVVDAIGHNYYHIDFVLNDILVLGNQPATNDFAPWKFDDLS